MKVKYTCSNGLVGCRLTGEIEVDDDATDEDIEESVRDAVHERLEWWWEKDTADKPQEAPKNG